MINRSVLILLSIFVIVFFSRGAVADVTFQYDINGNLTSDGGKYFEYNDANQLVRVRHGDATGPILAEYSYDHQGQRVKKVEGGVTTYYVGKHYESRLSQGETKNTSYYFANGERVAKKDPSGSRIYYHSDHLGGTNALTNASGSLIERISYYPFGEIREGGAERYAYTGKEKDATTSLYYYESRYYDSGHSHFTQADSAEPNLYDPQSLNKYAYVRNNPLKYVDPTGHTWWNPFTWSKNQSKQQIQPQRSQPADDFQAGGKIAKEVSIYGKYVAVGLGKDILKHGTEGVIWATKRGYRDLAALQGASKGAIRAKMQGTRIMGSIGTITGGYLVDQLLDSIEGKGETVPFLAGPYGLGKIIFRYHTVGGETADIPYSEWIQQNPDCISAEANAHGEN